jgi:hypothetical protein
MVWWDEGVDMSDMMMNVVMGGGEGEEIDGIDGERYQRQPQIAPARLVAPMLSVFMITNQLKSITNSNTHQFESTGRIYRRR